MPKQTFFNLDQEKQDRIIDSAIDEFAVRNFDSAKLSNIIKASGIPRGSFYQYFEDKKDLLLYVMKIIGDKKMQYMSETLKNPDEIPFLSLFKELYLIGVQFSIDNPKYIQIAANIFSSKDRIFDEMMKDNLDYALQFFTKLIDLDKERGRIDPEIDSNTFAIMARDMTTNISLSELESDNKEVNYQKMIDRVSHIITIFEKGVKQGEYDV